MEANQIITFYSYKGGTGRSMLLANVAWVLASNQRKVLVIDWDFEAPGLSHYFSPFLSTGKRESTPGLIDFVIDYASELTAPCPSDRPPESGKGQSEDHADWREAIPDLDEYILPLDWEFGGAGRLDLIQSGMLGPTYTTRVNTFNWGDFYERLYGGAFFEEMKARLKARYEFILIDSRTGETDTSGICTIQMPDSLVVCFTLNNQSIHGASKLADYVQTRRAGLDIARQRSIRIFPVPTRIDKGEKERFNLRMDFAEQKFNRFLSHLTGPSSQYWSDVRVPYETFYAYEEQLAVCADRPHDLSSLLSTTERITSWLTDGRIQKLGQELDSEKREQLRLAYQSIHERATDAPLPSAPPASGYLPGWGWAVRQFRRSPGACAAASLALLLLLAALVVIGILRFRLTTANSQAAISKAKLEAAEREFGKLSGLATNYVTEFSTTQSNLLAVQRSLAETTRAAAADRERLLQALRKDL